jgi:hypothetical protein
VSVLILAVDPGANRTGYCWKLRQDAKVWPTLNSGIVKAPNLLDWFGTWENWTKLPHDKFIVVAEDFIQRTVTDTNRSWTKQPTAKIIGAIRLRTHQLGGDFLLAQPGNLQIGAKLAGIGWSGKSHLRDDLAAEAHAAYLCVHGMPKVRRDWLD